MEAQEHERSRVARELHDDVCQRMAVLALHLSRLANHIPEREVDARRQVRDLYQEVGELGQHVNDISHRLHSSKLQLLGLAEAAATFCREVSIDHGVAVDFVDDDVPATLPDGVAINLFRVLQEALANAVKHSGASRYVVSLRGTDDQLRLEVIDDGRGFDPEVAMATSGLGLVSMQERIRLVNGDVTIESRPGAGTRIRASVPLRSPYIASAEIDSEIAT
jgi:signal transduction histidine kinase